MSWTLSEIASVAEILGLVAIVASLVFVGVQVSHNSRETRAATMQSALDAELFVSATHAEHAGTWNKAIRGLPFDSDDEQRRAIVLFNMIMTEGENRFHQFNSGYLAAAAWEGRLASLRRVRELPIFQIWRESPGALNHSAKFIELVDSLGGGEPTE